MKIKTGLLSKINLRSAIIVSLLAAMVALLGVYSGSRAQKIAFDALVESTWMGPPPPARLQDLINRSDLIVIGSIVNIKQEGYFQGYDENGKFIEAEPFVYSEEAPVDPNVPFVDYIIEVERVLLDDGTIQAGHAVVARATGLNPAGQEAHSLSKNNLASLGDRRLFFLGKNPDGKTYGLYYGPYGRLVIDGEIVTFSDANRTPVVFENGKIDTPVAPEEFIKIVENVIRSNK